MKPPESFNEISRLDAVSNYLNLPQWQNIHYFTKVIKSLRRNLKVDGVSVSVVDNYQCHLKHKTMLDTSIIPRSIAIDAHAILSKGFFCLLDASKDWRTSSNPIVAGPPYVKFYCAVPLIADNKEVIGVLAIFDQHPKDMFCREHQNVLKKISRDIMIQLRRPWKPTSRYATYFDRIAENVVRGGYWNKRRALKEQKFAIGKTSSSSNYNPTFGTQNKGLSNPCSQSQSQSQNRNRNLNLNLNPMLTPFDSHETEEICKINLKNKLQDDLCMPFLSTGGNQLLVTPSTQILDKQLWQLLFSMGSLERAASCLVEIIARKFEFDFVYVLEVSIADPCCVPKVCFPPKRDKIDLELFYCASKLNRPQDAQIEFASREISSYLTTRSSLTRENIYNESSFNKFYENSIHYKAFISEFGLEYKNEKQNSFLNHGLMMPFFRHGSKLVNRNTPVIENNESNLVDLYLRSGGFILAMFSENMKVIDAKKISSIFNYACIYRKIYIAN